MLFTDGKNEDPSSIALPALIAELNRLRDPKKPVLMYTIGFGNEVDAAVLSGHGKATGGRGTVTTDPRRDQGRLPESPRPAGGLRRRCRGQAAVGTRGQGVAGPGGPVTGRR